MKNRGMAFCLEDQMIIALPKILSEKLGDAGAEALVHVINEASANTKESVSAGLATKIDLSELKTDIIKWMFLFWIGQAATVIGTLAVMK